MKIRKSSIVLILFTLYGINYFIFERVLFFNEILSLIGLIYFIKYSFTKDYKFILPCSTIYRCVFLFLLLCSCYALASLLFKTNWYYYFRNLSIIYSIFSFFIGYHLYEVQFGFFEKMRAKIYGYALVSFVLRWPTLIDRNAYSFWFGLLQRNWKIISVLWLILLYVLYVAAFTSLTAIVILLIVLAVRFFIKGYAHFKLIVLVGIMAFCTIFILAAPYLKMYHQGVYAYRLFGNVELVYAQHPWFMIDHNSSWRLLFWYRTVIENFPQNLLGIGIGTPLLPYRPNDVTTDLGFSDEYLSHVIGTHNTFITIFIRFGLASVVILAVIYRSVFREFFIHKQYYLHNRNDGGLFFGFITITSVGLFNLLIESPTLASLYWISLGFVAKAIFMRQNQIDSTLPNA